MKKGLKRGYFDRIIDEVKSIGVKISRRYMALMLNITKIKIYINKAIKRFT